jgi:hypothetical protein
LWTELFPCLFSTITLNTLYPYFSANS